MKKRAIVTACIGEAYQKIANISGPTLKAYAARIEADLIVLTGRGYRDRHPYWEKFRVAEYLEFYERVCWMDLDVIVNPKAPSIFEAAPMGHFSAFDEGKVFADRQEQLWKDAGFYDFRPEQLLGWANGYFNVGVMVLEPPHLPLLLQPKVVKANSIMPEQTLLNLRLAAARTACHDLTSKWNGLHSIHKAGERSELHVVHYAGWPRTSNWVETMIAQMKEDLAAFK